MIYGANFFQMSNAIFSFGLTPIQLAVYCYLVSCTGQHEKCWPGMKTIAACCGCSENAARSAIQVLDERGFIRRVPTFRYERNGKRRQANNTYFLLDLPELPKPSPRELRHPTARSSGEMYEQEEDTKMKDLA